MDKGATAFCAMLFIALAALSSIASSNAGRPDMNGAVASALKHHLADFLGEDIAEGKDASAPPLVLCLESKVPLQIGVIASDLADTVIEPVPANECTSEITEGPFGMFTAITKYRDASGGEAGHLEIAGVSCPSTTTCIVDIDSFGSGQRYMTRRKGQVWSVVERTMRWVV